MQSPSSLKQGFLLQGCQQYGIRIISSAVALIALSWQGELSNLTIGNPVLWIIAGYILTTTAVYVLNTKSVLTDRQLLYITIFTDTAGISLLLILRGESISPLCIAYYLLVIHHGINKRDRELMVSAYFSTFGFAAALYWSDYWNSQIPLGVGLLFGLALISIILYRDITKNSSDKGNHNSYSDKSTLMDKHIQSKGIPNNLKLLLITNDNKDRHMLLSYIDSWGINVDTYSSSVRAFAELVNSAENSDGYSTIIVDSLSLDMDPIQFAKYLRSESILSDIHLIYLSPEHTIEQKKQLLNAGYTTLLTTPIDKTILFDALHNSNAQIANDNNITKLIHHYSSKTDHKQTLDILLAACDGHEQKSLRAILENYGQRVYTVGNGSQTLDALNTHQFDLVILDFNMPDIKGKEIIRLYYYTYLNEDWVPFVALVDEATPDILSQCREAEVNAVLVRPIKEDELFITVADIASSKVKLPDNIDCHWLPHHAHKTMIRDCDNQILNTQTLSQLKELSISKDFLNQLTKKFNEDMDILMDGLEQAVHNNRFTIFKELTYALKDSSCNLGADSLHRLSLLALQINQREFQEQAKLLLEELHDTLSKTKYALQNYAIELDNSASKNE